MSDFTIPFIIIAAVGALHLHFEWKDRRRRRKNVEQYWRRLGRSNG